MSLVRNRIEQLFALWEMGLIGKNWSLWKMDHTVVNQLHCKNRSKCLKMSKFGKICYTVTNGSHLQKWDTLLTISHAVKNGLHWKTIRTVNNGHIRKNVSDCKKWVKFRKMAHTMKMSHIWKKCVSVEYRIRLKGMGRIWKMSHCKKWFTQWTIDHIWKNKSH